MKQSCLVQICGHEIKINTDENPEYVEKLAEAVGRRANIILEGSTKCTNTEALIVCAIEMLDGKMKTRYELEKCREENENIRAENEKLQYEIHRLREKMKNGMY